MEVSALEVRGGGNLAGFHPLPGKPGPALSTPTQRQDSLSSYHPPTIFCQAPLISKEWEKFLTLSSCDDGRVKPRHL